MVIYGPFFDAAQSAGAWVGGKKGGREKDKKSDKWINKLTQFRQYANASRLTSKMLLFSELNLKQIESI